MTRTKKYLIVIGIILLFIMILSAILSKEFTSNTSTEINAPANFVYNAINDLDHHKSFNPKAIKDTSFQMMFLGAKIGADASCDYTGRTTGAGVMQIKESNGADSIVVIDSPSGEKQKKYIFRMVAKDSTHTTVSIESTSESGFITNLWNVIHRWRLKKESGIYLDQLGQFVKGRYENKVYHGYHVREMAMNRKFFIGHRSEVAIENASQFYSQNIAALYQKALNSKIVIAGMPCAIFFKWDEKNNISDMAAALPTLAEISLPDAMPINLKSQNGLMIEYKGERENTQKAHDAMSEYILDHKLLTDMPVVEEYLTDPSKEPDPTKWVTNIYYYVTPK